MSAYEPISPAAPVEDVNRGTVVALAAIPIGIIVWTVVWSIGFIVSIIMFGVAFLATFLYKLGSGGVIGRAGAIRVSIITIITLVLAIIAGLVADVAIFVGEETGVSPIAALSHPEFGNVFSLYIGSGDTGLLFSIGIAVLFGILGCFGVLRNAFRATAPAAPAAQTPWPTLPASPDNSATPTATEPEAKP